MGERFHILHEGSHHGQIKLALAAPAAPALSYRTEAIPTQPRTRTVSTGAIMAKKHRTAVPDFSSHKPQTKLPGPGAAKAPVPVPAPRVKPQATSAKSGRRGG